MSLARLLPYVVLAVSGLLVLLSLLARGSQEFLLLASLTASLLALLSLIVVNARSLLAAALSLLSLLSLLGFSLGFGFALPLSILLLSLVAYLLAGRAHVLLLSLGAAAPLLSSSAGLMSALIVSYLVLGLTPIRELRSCPFRMDSNLLFFGTIVGSVGVLLQLTPLSWLSETVWLSGLLLLLSGLIVPLGPSSQQPSSV